MGKSNSLSSEADKKNIIPPEDPIEFDKWRRSVDPDTMGFDGQEVEASDDDDNS